MPEMSGLAVAEAIHRDPRLSGTKIVMLTSAEDRACAGRRRELDIVAHLTKPVSQSDLFNAIVGIFAGTSDLTRQDDVPTDKSKTCRPLRILLAEDNAVNQKVATRLLEKWGHQVTVVGDGLAVLEAIRRDRFNVILMDIQMPDLDGLETTTRIRQQEKSTGGHIPIVAVTAHATQRDKDLCLQTGMDAYVSKPICREDLLQILCGIAGKAAASSVNEAIPATADRTAGGAESPPFDKDKVLQRFGGDEGLLKEISALFLETCPQLLADTKVALDHGDYETLARAAHTLKGSLGNFAADQAFRTALNLESAAKDVNLAAAQEMWALLAVEVDKLKTSLHQVVEGKPLAGHNALDL